MEEERPCEGCAKVFHPRNKAQRYCHDTSCQRTRKSRWQKRKLADDPEYRGNQADARKRWQKKKPNYWHEYRESHPHYTARNRQRQRLRNQRKRHPIPSTGLGSHPSPSEPVIANMDVASPVKSGTYRLVGVEGTIANMDVVVELSLLSTSYGFSFKKT